MEVVVTLPIAPKIQPEITFLESSFVADVISRLTKKQFILPLNFLGQSHSEKVVDPDLLFCNYKNLLNRFGINPSRYWRDSSSEHLLYVQEAVDLLNHLGFIKISREKILKCDCGTVEILASTKLLPKGKVYNFLNGEKKCILCNSVLKLVDTESIFLRLPFLKQLKILPQKLDKRAQLEMKNSCSYSWRISRIRNTGVSVEIGNKQFYLDPDFLWMIISFSMLQKRIKVNTVISSSRSLRKAILFCILSNIFSKITPTLLLHPYVKLNYSKDNFWDWETSQFKATSLFNRYGRYLCRIFQGLGLNWGKLEFSLETSRLFWLSRSINNLLDLNKSDRLFKKPLEIEDIINKVNTNTISEFITLSRRREKVSTEFRSIIPAIIGK